MTRREYKEFWTEVKRVVVAEDGEPAVKQTICCCADPGMTRRQCADKAGNMTPCRCHCHSKRK